jgi:hypothetical protein
MKVGNPIRAGDLLIIARNSTQSWLVELIIELIKRHSAENPTLSKSLSPAGTNQETAALERLTYTRLVVELGESCVTLRTPSAAPPE